MRSPLFALPLPLLAFAAVSLHAGGEVGGHACCAAATAPSAIANLPDDSLYQLSARWTDQHGRVVALADFAGQPVVISMVFTHCAYACPRIIADLKNLRAALPNDVRERVRIILVSFDTVRDTPERLRAWAHEQQLDEHWTLLHGTADAVRELAVLLDIPYARQADGSFGHGNRLVLLDTRGAPAASVEGLGAAPTEIVSAATALERAP
jgi:protein SCO1